MDTGELLWNITGWLDSPAISDGILIAFNVYDGQVYGFGKGPTATTITAPDVEMAFGSSVAIRGTVTDISAGAKQTEIAARFPNGVPAVSDESQSAWMEYVYMQKATSNHTLPVLL